MSNQQIDYDEIRARVEKRIKQRMEFWIHLASFVAVNLFLWMIYFTTTPGGFPWPIFPTGGWGIGLLIHGANVYLNGTFDSMREREVQREIEREQLRRGIYNEKPKNDNRAVRISDEGELIADDNDSQTDQDGYQAARTSRSNRSNR